jgi:hypothetical protein
MLEANFAAFHRNKKGGHREVIGRSCVDFRFRNVEKWFDERRAVRTQPPIPSVKRVSYRLPPPGLKREAKDADIWDKDELVIPTYDTFQFTPNTNEVKDCVNLLPDNWYSEKWRNYLDNTRSDWFALPPKAEEGDCVTESDDLPFAIYQSGRAALDSLPFVNAVDYNYYMVVFQEYYKMFNSGCM